MPLPDLIEIVPLSQQVQAQITVPGSKSITNRALILAALAKGETTLRGALWSEDTQVMVECLQKLGFSVKIEEDPNEYSNCFLTVKGCGGEIPNAGTVEKPLELFVGNAGTAARFLSAFVCLGKGVYRLSGIPRMHQRPQAALFDALRELGYRIDSENNKLPAVIHGLGPHAGKCKVSIEESSQFASALLLCSKIGGWDVEVVGYNTEESSYVTMTSKLMEAFPKEGGTFEIEPDASSGSYFFAIQGKVEGPEFMEHSNQFGMEVRTRMLKPIVAHWPSSGWQLDAEYPKVMESIETWGRFLRNMAASFYSKDAEARRKEFLAAFLACWRKSGLEVASDISKAMDSVEALDVFLKSKNFRFGTETVKELLSLLRLPAASAISRRRDLGDSIMTAIVMAPFSATPIRFTDLGRLRVQECERVEALRTELTKCGAKVIEKGDTLEVFPSQLHGAEIETYNDHRMAMCFAILGLKVPGIKIKNPACVKKTFPNFFQKLAAAPPNGFGATILDANTGRPLSGQELFAD